MAIPMKQNLKRSVMAFLDTWYAIKNKKIQWRMDNQAQQHLLKQQQALSEYDLTDQLKKRRVQLDYELSLLKTTHDMQLKMLKTKCLQDINDYKQYLASLDQLKQSIQNSYTHLPDAIAFTIHHHAKQLLNAMWEAPSDNEKMQYELQLIRFMTTIQEDTRLSLSGESQSQQPEKTLKMLERL